MPHPDLQAAHAAVAAAVSELQSALTSIALAQAQPGADPATWPELEQWRGDLDIYRRMLPALAAPSVTAALQ